MRRRLILARDDGYSILELTVSMAIMSVVMIVAFSGISEIYTASNRVEGTSFGREQLGTTFQRLNKELRYATWIATPGQVGTAWYMEYAMATNCRQLKFDGGRLTLASWTPPADPGPPVAIASDLTLLNGIAPFTLYNPGDKPYATASAGSGMGKLYETEYSQVRMRFNATVGKVTLPFDTVFTAQNTSRNTFKSPNDCGQGRP